MFLCSVCAKPIAEADIQAVAATARVRSEYCNVCGVSFKSGYLADDRAVEAAYLAAGDEHFARYLTNQIGVECATDEACKETERLLTLRAAAARVSDPVHNLTILAHQHGYDEAAEDDGVDMGNLVEVKAALAEKAAAQLSEQLRALNAQVTSLQERCTALLEEKRRAYIDYSVREFHLAMGIPAPAKLVELPDDRIRYRFRLMGEEFMEMVEAAFADSEMRPWWIRDVKERLSWLIENCPVKIDMPALVDATHDLDYVVAGTRVEYGYYGLPGALEVQAANMRKVGGPMREDGKQLKPPGWVGPDLVRVLREQGWKEPV